MAEYAVYQGRTVEVVKRRGSPDGKTEASVQIKLPTGELKVVLPTTLSPVGAVSAQPPVQPTEVQLNLFDQPPVISAAMESFAPIANPGPVPKRSVVYIDYVSEPADLVKLPTIGKMTAKAILERRDAREGGKYGSFEAMVSANSEFKHIDWDMIRGLVSFEVPSVDE